MMESRLGDSRRTETHVLATRMRHARYGREIEVIVGLTHITVTSWVSRGGGLVVGKGRACGTPCGEESALDVDPIAVPPWTRRGA